MNWVIYLFGSGVVFFLGIGLVLIGPVLFMYCQHRWMRALASLFAFIGLLLVGLSATPLSYWIYVVAGGTTLVWLIAERGSRGWLAARRNLLRGLVVAVWVLAAVIELPYHVAPTLNAKDNPKLYIIADSVTAGMGGEQETWPRLLASSRPVQVVDLSRMGATVRSALQQSKGLPPEASLVLLEIGGNDLLGSTTSAEFEECLDRLLASVCRPGRTVLMFELPLPPFCNEFGRAQRRLASKHAVALIPKRIFVSVLTGEGMTLDSIHLAREGHERMAEVVWGLIQSAYSE